MNQSINEIQQILDGWNGSNAMLWYYTASHGHLEVRIQQPRKRKGNIHLICEDCRSIQGPAGWSETSIKIEETGNQLDGSYRITDKAAGFETICDLVQITNNVDPVY